MKRYEYIEESIPRETDDYMYLESGHPMKATSVYHATKLRESGKQVYEFVYDERICGITVNDDVDVSKLEEQLGVKLKLVDTFDVNYIPRKEWSKKLC